MIMMLEVPDQGDGDVWNFQIWEMMILEVPDLGDDDVKSPIWEVMMIFGSPRSGR